MSNNKYIRLIKDVFIFTIGTVLAKAIQFILMPLYTTYMTTEAYGIAELTNNMSELLYPIVTLCIYEATFRFVVGSKYSKDEIISSSIKIILLSSLIGAIFVIVSQFIFYYEYTIYLYIILYAYSLKMLLAFYIRGKGQNRLFAISGIFNAVFLALFSVIFLVYLKLDVKGYLLAIAFSYILTMILLFIFGKVYKDIKFNIKNRDVTKDMLKYCLPLIIYNVGYWLTTMSGRYILLWNTSSSKAGLYSAVMKMSAIINMLQQAFYAAFQLNNSREYESKDKEIYFSNIFRLYSAVIFIFGTIIICCSPILSKITLKNEFYVARVYLPIVLFTSIIDCMFCYFKTMYTTYKKTKRAVPSMIIGAVINIVVGLITVKRFDIWGICIASLVSYLVQAIYRFFDTKQFVNIECNWKLILASLLLLLVQSILIINTNIYNICIAIGISVIIIVINTLQNINTIKTLLQNIFKNKGMTGIWKF